MKTFGQHDPEKIAWKLADQLSAVTKSFTVSDDDVAKALEAFEVQKSDRHYKNEFIPISFSPLTFVATAPEVSLSQEQPWMFPWFWNSHLCPIYTLTMWWETHDQEKRTPLRMFMPVVSEGFRTFLNGDVLRLGWPRVLSNRR